MFVYTKTGEIIDAPMQDILVERILNNSSEKWFSVEEKLPEEGLPFWGIIPKDGVNYTQKNGTAYVYGGCFLSNGIYKNGNFEDCNGNPIEKVAFWREPPVIRVLNYNT